MTTTEKSKQSSASAQKTANHTSDAAAAAYQSGAGAPDVSALTVDAFAALYSEIHEAWEVQEFNEGTTADANEDSFVLADPDVDGDEYLTAGDPFDGKASLPPTSINELVSPLDPKAAEIVGTDDSDTIFGTHNNDLIEALGGTDFVYARAGNDTVFGGNGRDVVYGGDGADTIYGNANADHLEGGLGNDTIYGGFGKDTLEGGYGNNKLYGGKGSDVLIGEANKDEFYGGAGIDTVSFADANQEIDVALWLNGQQDTGQGLDTFSSIENIIGSNFNDHISGSNGNNLLEGGAGDDVIDGGSGNDYLSGGADNDLLSGGTGNDVYNGGAGEDRASFTGSANGVVVNLGTSNPQNTGDGIDTFFSIEHVFGSNLGDLIFGSADDNYLLGKDGDDWIWGAAGNDGLHGDQGSDVLNGGAGDDTLVGGSGYSPQHDGVADAFVFSAQGDAGNDTIIDFEDGVDKVFVESGFSITEFSDLTLETNENGHAVAYLTGDFPDGNLGSLTFQDVSTAQLNANDFVFF